MKYTRHTLFKSWATACAGLLLAACASYEPVESTAITSALDFDDTNRFEIDVPDTALGDTAYSERMQAIASQTLIDELESRGFDYVGERNPDLQIRFSTYAPSTDGYIDTTNPEGKRLIQREGLRGATQPVSAGEIRSVRQVEPIYVRGGTRVFVLDVIDTKSDALLWRGYVSEGETALNEEDLALKIDRLVDELDQQT